MIDLALRRDPRYRLVKATWKVFHGFDPKLKGALTQGKDLLKRLGWKIADRAEVEIVEQVEQLSEREFEIEYVSGLGVTYIKVTRGEPMTPHDLERLAHGGSLLLDYYIFPGANKEPGESWSVQAEEVSSLVAFGLDTTARGELKLKREQDEVDDQGRPIATLALVGGEVDFLSPSDPADHEARIRPKGKSILQFSLDEKMLCEARLNWTMDTWWSGKGHLLSGLTKRRAINVQSYYEAARIDHPNVATPAEEQ
ncbi:MAG: hypothetical protein KY475_20610 [Planctomycetes bacterium]|nr:hypothetical protein [Planctomycetota bacterium]